MKVGDVVYFQQPLMSYSQDHMEKGTILRVEEDELVIVVEIDDETYKRYINPNKVVTNKEDFKDLRKKLFAKELLKDIERQKNFIKKQQLELEGLIKKLASLEKV
jgi:ABC-type xylose transport system substrate-binding protein